tara:strand:- start:1938 stop:2795 length:858 start_codon:yes stop_codon:yes gene_type:complete
MSNLPEVAFIVPLYNSNLELLNRSLNSIINQFYKGNIIIYCILDGENEKIKSFLENYKINISDFTNRKLHIFSKNNSGLADTLNYGLINSQENYIFRQDDDDTSLPERVSKTIDTFHKFKNIQVIATSALIWNSKVEYRTAYKLKNYPSNKLAQLSLLICGYNPVCHPTVCFNMKRILEKLGRHKRDIYPNSLTEDHALWYELALKNIFIHQLPYPSVIYTIRENQYSSYIFSSLSGLYFWRFSIKLLKKYKFLIVLLFFLFPVLLYRWARIMLSKLKIFIKDIS